MATKAFTQSSGASQADFRDYAVFYDQHKSPKFPQGRPWWAVVERPAEGAAMPQPVGELQPQGWGAPWYPDSHYMTKAIGKARPGATMQEHRFTIDYISMISDRKTAMVEYYNRAVLEAVGQGWNAPEYGDPISYRLRAIVGVPPQSPKVPEAALAEDPWILGFSAVENTTLARLLQLGHEDILTAQQSEKKVDELAELKAQMAMLVASQTARDEAAVARMAKARAARKPKAQTTA